MWLALAAFLGMVVLVMWLWHGRRDPLIQLVPFALAFPPIIVYGERALGWSGGWLSTRVALVACALAFVLFRILWADFSWQSIPGKRFIAPYFLLVLVSLLWRLLRFHNEDAGDVADGLWSWAVPAVVFILIAGSWHGESDIRRASRVLLVITFSEALYSGFQALVLTGHGEFVPRPIADLTLQGREDLWFGAIRLYGTLPNLGPNFLGAFLLTPTVLAFSCAFTERGRERLVWLLGGVVGSATIVGTYSRGAMLGLASALVLLALWRRSIFGAVGAVAGISLTALLVAQTPMGRHAASLYSAGQLDPSATARVYLWNAILSSTAEHPLGLGFNGWLRVSRTSIDVGLADSPASIGAAHPAENQWLRELADRGIPGLFALGLLIGGLIRMTFRAADSRRASGHSRDYLAAAGAASVGWALCLLTGDHLMYDSVAGMFWYTSALAVAAVRDATRPVARHT
jgi:O-antigen ligase